MDTENELLSRLGVTPEQVVGYFYAGLFSAVVCSLVAPAATKATVDNLGPVLATLAAFALGVGIYVLYRRLIGELLLYPIYHAVHGLIDALFRRPPERRTSTTNYLGGLGVPLGCRRIAYTTIREVLFDTETQRRLDLAHGEIHVLYLTAIECWLAALYLRFEAQPVAGAWIITALLAFLAALFSDTRQHSLEVQLLRNFGAERLRTFLEESGYLDTRKKSPPTPVTDTHAGAGMPTL